MPSPWLIRFVSVFQPINFNMQSRFLKYTLQWHSGVTALLGPYTLCSHKTETISRDTYYAKEQLLLVHKRCQSWLEERGFHLSTLEIQFWHQDTKRSTLHNGLSVFWSWKNKMHHVLLWTWVIHTEPMCSGTHGSAGTAWGFASLPGSANDQFPEACTLWSLGKAKEPGSHEKSISMAHSHQDPRFVVCSQARFQMSQLATVINKPSITNTLFSLIHTLTHSLSDFTFTVTFFLLNDRTKKSKYSNFTLFQLVSCTFPQTELNIYHTKKPPVSGHQEELYLLQMKQGQSRQVHLLGPPFAFS